MILGLELGLELGLRLELGLELGLRRLELSLRLLELGTYLFHDLASSTIYKRTFHNFFDIDKWTIDTAWGTYCSYESFIPHKLKLEHNIKDSCTLRIVSYWRIQRNGTKISHEIELNIKHLFVTPLGIIMDNH